MPDRIPDGRCNPGTGVLVKGALEFLKEILTPRQCLLVCQGICIPERNADSPGTCLNCHMETLTSENVVRPPDRMLTTLETAAYLGISRDGVDRLVREGLLVPVFVGKRKRFTRAVIDQYVASNTDAVRKTNGEGES